MKKKQLESLKQMSVTASEHFTQIMEKYDVFGRHMSISGFWKKYVVPLDPTITRRMWDLYVKKYEAIAQEHVDNKLKESVNKALTAAQLENSSLDKVLQIADSSLGLLAQNPAELEKIPITTRMRWFFSAMKARDARIKTNVVLRQEERNQSMFEKMLEGAQYGGFNEGEVPQTVEATAAEILNEDAEDQSIPHQLPGAV